MIDIPNVTLVSFTINQNRDFFNTTVAVLRYMQSVARFGRMTFFTALLPKRRFPGVEVIVIPSSDKHIGLGYLLNVVLRYFVRTPFLMHCQDDGFILDPSLWEQEFLKYDFIGAPWADGTVGNEGFSIQSQKYLWARGQFVWDGVDGPDWFYCRTMREEMLKLGITFAPTEVADRFSSELRNHDTPTFGYHGRGYSPEKHTIGQQIIQAYR